MNQYASGAKASTRREYAHAMQAVREAGDVADGGDRPKYACQRSRRVDRHRSGVCTILGLCRLAVLRLLGTSLGWLAGGPQVDGRTPARTGRVRFMKRRMPAASASRTSVGVLLEHEPPEARATRLGGTGDRSIGILVVWRPCGGTYLEKNGQM